MRERVVARYLAGADWKRLDLSWVQKIRKDFLTLMKNIDLVKDYKTGAKLRDAFNVFRQNFDNVVFEHFLNESLKYYQPRTLNDSDKSYIEKKLRKSGWDLSIELRLPLGYPDEYLNEGVVFARFERERRTWEQRLRRKAQVFWKDLKEVIEWHDKFTADPKESGPGFVVKMPSIDRVVLEGFQAEVSGYDPEWDLHRDALERLKEGLKLYRRNASKAFPLLLQKQLPLHVKFDSKLDEGGRYERDHIMIAPLAFPSENANFVAHVMAHEMAHHIYKAVLSDDAQKFWSAAIRADYGPIDLGDLLAKWSESWRWADDFVKHMADKDPILALQVDVASHGFGGREDRFLREDFQAAYDRGERTLAVPKTPISGYASKNAEEAFCEAIGRLVGFGPAAVHTQIRHWLETILPGQIKLAYSYDRQLVGK